MSERLLITFGCSWTQGVGVGYQPAMVKDDYMKIAWDQTMCEQWSYRGLLCDRFGMTNLNFAHGGSSNQAQFYYAKKYFGSDRFLNDQKTTGKIVVLHAITSTARNFYFDQDLHNIRHVKYNTASDTFSKFMMAKCYNHEFEVQQLVIEMNFWNLFYKSNGIRNIWIDTFNHHDYNAYINNLMDPAPFRDLLSQMCIKNQIDVSDKKQYHKSDWIIDDDRVSCMIELGLLNPISNHPTRQGHQQIADIVAPFLQSCL